MLKHVIFVRHKRSNRQHLQELAGALRVSLFKFPILFS